MDIPENLTLTRLTVFREQLDVKLGHRRVSPVFAFYAGVEIFSDW